MRVGIFTVALRRESVSSRTMSNPAVATEPGRPWKDCPLCGALVFPKDKKCRMCGTILEFSTEETPNPVAETVAPAWPAIGLTAVPAIGLGVFAYVLSLNALASPVGASLKGVAILHLMAGAMAALDSDGSQRAGTPVHALILPPHWFVICLVLGPLILPWYMALRYRGWAMRPVRVSLVLALLYATMGLYTFVDAFGAATEQRRLQAIEAPHLPDEF